MSTAGNWPIRTRGYALLVVLWFLVSISTISMIMLTSARSETALAANVKSAAQAEALADAGVARAAFNQMVSDRSERWEPNTQTHRIRLTEGTIDISLSDENRKINPNRASDALLASLFEAAGVDRVMARRLGAAVADWVSPDGAPREFGAKLDQYRAAGRGYGPANAPLQSLEDLQLVLGMTPAIYSSVRPYLTIFTESGEPKSKTLPPVVRRALAIAARNGEGDGEDASAPAQAAATSSAPANSSDANEKPVIEVTSVGRSGSGGVFVRIAVLRLDTDDPKGYAVLDWRRGRLSD